MVAAIKVVLAWQQQKQMPTKPVYSADITAAASKLTNVIATNDDFRKKIRIERCLLAFSAYTFFARILLQQANGNSTHGRKVSACISIVNTTLIFPKTDIQLPMKVILNPPVKQPPKRRLVRHHRVRLRSVWMLF